MIDSFRSKDLRCHDKSGIPCVGCLGREGRCNGLPYEKCSKAFHKGSQWCEGKLIMWYIETKQFLHGLTSYNPFTQAIYKNDRERKMEQLGCLHQVH